MLKLASCLLSIVALATFSGCRTEPAAATTSGDLTTRMTYSVAPKTLYEKVKSVVSAPPISLPIESEKDGRITTGWQSNTGAHVSAGLITRDWQERTRYTISIAPAWDDPNKSTIEVTEESQQRPHDGHEWGSQPDIKRPARAAELLKRIDAALAQSKPSANSASKPSQP